MKSRILLPAFFLICLLATYNPNSVLASHIYGAEISYTCIDQSNDQYFVKLKLYSECGSVGVPSVANVTISSTGCATSSVETLAFYGEHESSPYCATELVNTACNGGALPGFKVGFYGKIVTMSGTCNDWVISHAQCCRNPSVTNLVNASSNDIYVKNELDATAATCNSSPQWHQPAVVFCGSTLSIIDLGATDPDGDSLSFSLVSAMGSGGTPIAYNIGYNPTSPVSSSTPISFDAETGILTYTPSIAQVNVINVKVDEFRNGNHIASAYRDIQILNTPAAVCTNPNFSPELVSGPSNFVNASLSASGFVEVCGGADISFDVTIASSTVFGPAVDIESNASAIGGTLTSNAAIQTFTWQTTLADTGIHLLTIVAREGCLTPGIGMFCFLINVTGCTVSGPVEAGPDQMICQGASVQLQATGGIDYVWTPATGLSDPNISNPVASPTATTTYYVSSYDGGMLLSTDSLIITVAGGSATVDITIVSGSANLCLDDTLVLDATTTGGGFLAYSWSTNETTSSISLHNFNPISFSSVVSVTVSDNSGCTSSDTIVLSLQDDCVWPGDADYDGVANNFDVLNIGLGFGSTGSSRAGSTINWESQYANDWVDTFTTGANYKHADCNGDGTIDNSDTAAISQNYGLTHAKGSGANGSGILDPALYFTFSNDSVMAGDSLIIYANLGRDTLPAANVYGIAFTVNYDASLVDTGSVSTDYNNSWIDIPTDGLLGFTKKFENAGLIDIAITRTDMMNATTNYGPIGSISVVMKDDISGKDQISKAFSLSFAKVRVVSADGTRMDVYSEDNAATVSQELVGIDELSYLNSVLDIYPNPSTGLLNFKLQDGFIEGVTIYNLIGEVAFEDAHFTNQSQVSLSSMDLDSGIYLVRVQTTNGVVVRKITILD